VDWIHLAQVRYRWRAVVNAVMNLPVSGAAKLITKVNDFHLVDFCTSQRNLITFEF
jgi:hypothetical protein